MPELPEVETYVNYFRPLLEGRRIVRYVTRWAKQAAPSAAAVRRGVTGKRVARLRRRAKFVVADLVVGQTNGRGDGHLLIHLRMSGSFRWAADRADEPPHVRAFFELDDGNRWLFCDARKFGRIIYTTDFDAAVAHLGLEPLGDEFTLGRFTRLLRERSRLLKPMLLDQALVAGLGNIYVDESLHLAGLHPLRRSDTLTNEEISKLRRTIRSVLRKAISLGGTSFDWVYPDGGMERHLTAYGRAGEPCKKCRTKIERQVVGQRGTHVCPKCQPL